MKQIRKLLFVLLATSLMYACGEAGLGFDVTADFPVTAPIEIPIPGVPGANNLSPDQTIDPDLTVLDYSLGDVSAFGDALNELGSVGIDEDAIAINGLSFEILGIDADEELALDELSINIFLGSTVVNIPLAENTLTNKSKTPITLKDANGNDVSGDLLNQLRSSGAINTEIVVDLAAFRPVENDRAIGFDFKIYFDVLLKVRDL